MRLLRTHAEVHGWTLRQLTEDRRRERNGKKGKKRWKRETKSEKGRRERNKRRDRRWETSRCLPCLKGRQCHLDLVWGLCTSKQVCSKQQWKKNSDPLVKYKYCENTPLQVWHWSIYSKGYSKVSNIKEKCLLSVFWWLLLLHECVFYILLL